MKCFTTSLYAAAAVALALAAAPAHAAVISGTNLDFEANVGLTPNTDSAEAANSGTTAIPGWTVNAFAPGPFQTPGASCLTSTHRPLGTCSGCLTWGVRPPEIAR